MKRILLMFLRSFFFLPYYYINLKRYRNKDKFTVQQRYDFLRRIAIVAIRRGRVKIICTGTENLPSKTGYILYPNHQGLFDGMAFLQTHNRPFATVTKIEAKDTPLLRDVLKVFDSELMDRNDIRQSLTIIMNVAKRVQQGDNFLLFAEGTRSRKGNELLEFKHGSFKAATMSKCPIVPVALVDSFLAFDSGSIKKMTMQIHYLPPMYYEEYKDMKTAEIAQVVSDRIKATIAAKTIQNTKEQQEEVQ